VSLETTQLRRVGKDVVADVLALEKVVDAGMEVALQPIQIKIDDF
jgi:hypothetical protein